MHLFNFNLLGQNLGESTRGLPRLLHSQSQINSVIERMEDTHYEGDGDDIITLSDSTLAALASFIDRETATQQALVDLEARSYARTDSSIPIGDGESTVKTDETPEDLSLETRRAVASSTAVPLKDYKHIFKENWQLSQFWYTEDTANRLVEAILKLSKSSSRIAFLCCPTLYVAYKERVSESSSSSSQTWRLFEKDTRFSIFASNDFVSYDLNEPSSFASTQLREELHHSQDIVIVDPPFHAQDSQENLAITIRHILRPEAGCVVLLTGISMAPLLEDIYHDLPKLVRRDIVVEHDGLRTPYGCWVGKSSGAHDADESGFGNVFIENN